VGAITNLAVDESETSLADLLDRAESGELVTVSRGGRPVAPIVSVAPAHDPEKMREALEARWRLREQNRAEHGPVALGEILASKHEGHRY
jgi:prevent-host-death family protein